MGAKRLGYFFCEMTRVENRGGTTRGETTRGETSWGETSCYLTPYTVKETRPFSCIAAVAAIFTCKSFVLLK